MLGAMIDSELMAMASIHYDVDADRPEEWEEEEEEEEEEVGSTSVPKQHLAVDSPARITQSKRTSTAVGEDAEDEGNILTIKKSRTYTKKRPMMSFSSASMNCLRQKVLRHAGILTAVASTY